MAKEDRKGVGYEAWGTPSEMVQRAGAPSACQEVGSFALLFDRVAKIDDRLGRVETAQDIIVSGQAAINERLIEQRVEIGRFGATLEYIRGDIGRHDAEIVQVEQTAHSLGIITAEGKGRRGAIGGLIKAVWDAKPYWLVPILAAAATYMTSAIQNGG